MAYFVNAVKDQISVNLNNALQNTALSPRPGLDGDVQSITMAVAPFEIKPNKEKSVFGLGSINRVVIQFASIDPSNRFDITVSSLSGQNLYFYVFENTMVGQDEQGSSFGIKIEMLQNFLRAIQGDGVE
jgi:hypothetical protein